MKNIFSLAAALVILCGTAHAQTCQPVELKGKFQGYNGQEAIFFNGLQDEMGTDIEVDEDGNFALTTLIEKPTFEGMITVDMYFMRFYIEPGGIYIFDIDLSDESAYKITGTHERENELFKSFYLGNLDRGELESHAGNFKNYKSYVDCVSSSLLSEVNKTQNPEFIAGMSRMVNDNSLFNLYCYAFISARETGTVTDDPEFGKWIAGQKWDTMHENALMQYGILASSISYSYGDVDREVVLRTLDKIIPDKNVSGSVATTVMLNYLSAGGSGDKYSAYAYYKNMDIDPQMKSRVEQAYESSKFLGEGSDAPDFTMKGVDGRELNFSDLRGKVIYVDVWATWCGPCKVQIPYFARLAEHFANDDRIEFVSISVDENVGAWKKMVEDEAHEWPQFIVEGSHNDDFSGKYQITSIPRFMLFDREGKIISVNAPSPSEEGMAEYLESILSGADSNDMTGGNNLSNSFNDYYSKWRGKNKPAPDFTAFDIEGRPVRLSDYRGKVVILDFWFTSCHMCIKGFPALNELAAKYASQDVVAIAACTPEKKEDFERFVKENKDKYPNLIWVQDRSTEKFEDGFAMSDYGMFGAPSQIIIDKNGTVVSATNFKEQIISALPLAGIKVDPEELKTAQTEAKILEDRMDILED